MASVNEIRRTFLDYFQGHGHEIVASSPLVPQNDPTLMFTAAGMVQFKNVFTGVEKRPYNRAVTSQKCVRAGGKHNDLDNVGYTARHHTFFEMLGNFSFGDYFKDVAIELAWNLVTRDFGLPADRLLATVYAEDEVAFDLWKKIAGLPESRIIRIPTSDNFWAMGDTGPCGPCSEIFFDHGETVAGGPPGSPDEDGDRFVEIWNLVFMQYDQVTPDQRVDLPKPSIDTGMGLERMAAVLQGYHDNYQIDLFRKLIARSVELTQTPAEGEHAPSHKVIADHLRASAFLLAEGVMPGPEGRGYVLRRIMRRGMRHAHLLGAREPLMWRLVSVLVEEMGAAYPELAATESLIQERLRDEETRFRQTLERGLRLLDEETNALGEGDKLAGDVAFKLYDTYGFPLDLTQDALRSRGIQVDVSGFDAAMAEQKAKARASWKGAGGAAIESVWFDLQDRFGATEFLGYQATRSEAEIKAILVDGREVDELTAGTHAVIVTNQTPFYGESGGQQGDTGLIASDQASFRVTDTHKRLGSVFAHIGRLERGSLRPGDAVLMAVDRERRRQLRRAHSATHLLHAALRGNLGGHVAQKGSLVAPDRLRFDFDQPRPVTDDEIRAIETEVNAFVRQNDAVTTRLMAIDDAVKAGAMALFGEKYSDEVRVVTMGHTDDEQVYSMELCCGTHVTRTGDIGLVKLTSESGVSAGVRRVEALTGAAALDAVEAETALVHDLADRLKTTPPDLPARLDALLEERRRLERELTEARQKLAAGGGSANGEVKEDVGGIAFAGRTLDAVPAKDLRGVIDTLKSQLGSGVAAIVSVNEGKAAVVVGVTPDLVDRINAVDLVRAGVDAVGGKGGGGRPDFAQGGGPNGEAAAAAIEAIRTALNA
ncbi:MAG: alanine--tRNA ligase [Geminicoccaceae bacterium]